MWPDAAKGKVYVWDTGARGEESAMPVPKHIAAIYSWVEAQAGSGQRAEEVKDGVRVGPSSPVHVGCVVLSAGSPPIEL